MFAYERTDDRLTIGRPDTRWLSNGFDGGYATAAAAHNLTVEEGFDRTDLAVYAAERLGSSPIGPTLLTGVHQTNARGARYGPIEAVATAGLSNPAVLPLEASDDQGSATPTKADSGFEPGTVNVLLGSAEPLTDGGLAGMLATVVEAKTATLLEFAGCTGTTSDAVVVGSPDRTDGAAFAGSSTEIGNAARVCVRDAVVAALNARYEGEDAPAIDESPYGTVTSGSATVFEP
ncbi:MAG: adenosylcobinamide amidohydrolase [Halobacteriota archaeon]|uniref:adenosylcobinamide amidohydrolase n=1 Tax=Natronomonas sp. TaxID=2184060 RepID=UPI003976B1A3